MIRTNTRRTAALVAFALVLALAAPSFAAGATAGQVNINSASVEQLSLLPRIGPSVAQRIVDFRKENGPFKSVDDLMLVRGIGEKSLAGLREYLAISGETTLKTKVSSPRAPKADAEPKP
jgi:competence ComEA-like helix-hairpin-helix protein